MKPAPFTYHAPATLGDALTTLKQVAPEDGRVLAGGQSLVPMMALRVAAVGHLVDINGVAALDRVARENGVLVIGALARHARFHEPVVAGPLGRLLCRIAHCIAHHPIRLRGTFCGSLAHADPASEWCLVAATLDARLTIRDAAQTRALAADNFFEGAMTTALKPDELLSEARLPLPPHDSRMDFYEFSRRAGDFALAMSLVAYRVKDGAIAEPRIGVGGVEARPRRLAEAEAALTGRPAVRETFERAAEAAAVTIDPLVDAETDTAYRRDLTRTAVLRALEDAGGLR